MTLTLKARVRGGRLILDEPFDLPEGSEVKILSKRGEWVYAALPNNLNGWIPATSVESVRP